MEEVELLALLLILDKLLCENFVLLENCGEFLLGECILVGFSDNRFNRYLVETCLIESENVVGEIEVFLGESTSDIVLLVASALNEFFILRHDYIITSLTVRKNTEIVINFLTSVDRENNV